jgi:hypothetical protein
MSEASFNAEGLLFTPFENTKSGKRIRMNISQEDMANFDKLPSHRNEQTITIKNLKNGKKYVVRRADCGAGCYCAAEVVRILKPREKTFNAEGLLFTPYENTKSGKRITMNISQEDMAKFDKLPSQQNKQTITIKNLKNGKKYVVRRANCGAGCYCAAEVVRILKPREKTFNAPYAGAGALMPIKGDTALSSFSGKELAESSAIHGDFNQASLNYSGHQNLEVRGAESFVVEATEHHEIVLEVVSELRGLHKALNIVRRTQREGLHITTAEYEINKEIEFTQEVFDQITEDDFERSSFGADRECEDCSISGLMENTIYCDTCWESHRKNLSAEYGKRQRFGNRYVGRDTKGKFISNVSVGRSLKADRRNKSKTPARSGFGHRGDIQKGGATGFTLPSDTKRMIGMGAVLGGILAYWESKA